MTEKLCRKCDEVKPLSQFRTKAGNERLYCHDCERLRQQEYNEKRVQTPAERSAAWRSKNIDRSRELARKGTRKYRAKLKKEKEIAKEKLPDGYKRCIGCDEIKLFICFHKRKDSKDGYRNQCVKCITKPLIDPEYSRQWRKDNPDKLSSYWHTRRALEYAAKQREPIPKGFLVFTKSRPCCLCTVSPSQISHIVPLKRNGHHDIFNIVPLCKYHNGSQKDKLMSEWALVNGWNAEWLDKIIKHANLDLLESFNHFTGVEIPIT